MTFIKNIFTCAGAGIAYIGCRDYYPIINPTSAVLLYSTSRLVNIALRMQKFECNTGDAIDRHALETIIKELGCHAITIGIMVAATSLLGKENALGFHAHKISKFALSSFENSAKLIGVVILPAALAINIIPSYIYYYFSKLPE